MKKAEFEKIVRAHVLRDGAKPVDIYTTWETGVFHGWLATIIAIRNHVVHRYSAWTNEDGEVIVRYSACLS